MDLNELRARIDNLDDEITDLFIKRLAVAADIAKYKKTNNLPILNQSREDEVLARVMVRAGAEYSPLVKELFMEMFELSRSYQKQLSNRNL